jgi:nucleoid DNA-binding protein
MAVMEGFPEVVPKALATGKIVRLGEFGSFILAVNEEGAVTAFELNRQNITRTSVKFRPGKIFQKEVATIEFKKIS